MRLARINIDKRTDIYKILFKSNLLIANDYVYISFLFSMWYIPLIILELIFYFPVKYQTAKFLKMF